MNKSLVNDCIKLFIITLAAGLILGFVYNVTKDPIAKQEEKTKQEAYKAVFKDADRFEAVKLNKKEINKVLKAKNLGQNTVSEIAKAVDKDGKGLGYVFSVTNPDGYGGDITLSVGVKNDGTVNGYETLTISETAGLGMKADESEFKDQFKDKNVEKFTYTKNGEKGDDKIDAISGATITTNAVTNAVDSALVYFQNTFQNELGGMINE